MVLRPDVLSLYRFYQSAIGSSVAHIVNARLSKVWSNTPIGPLVSLGYGLPYIQSEEKPVALMPAGQGVVHWPTMEHSRVALVDEYHLPIADSSVGRMLIVHALEHSDRPAHFFREVWRVLAPGGQVVVISPNRRRAWSASDKTPFGQGRPYSRRQLSDLMGEQMLPPEQWDTALMLPPLHLPGSARLLRASERSIHSLGKNLGGVLIVSARKQVYGALPRQVRKIQTKPVLVPLPRTTNRDSFPAKKVSGKQLTSRTDFEQ